MDRPQLIRRLRIAVSVFFAVVTLALCVLWVRSYWWRDNLLFNCLTRQVLVASEQGQTALFVQPTDPVVLPIERSGWELSTDYLRRKDFYPFDHYSGGRLGFGAHVSGKNYGGIFAPTWSLALAASIAAFAFWNRKSSRFSLRTLLIATTLAAVVLGLGVWAAR
jgi:hypothetical protein